jgi:hypothetical protein
LNLVAAFISAASTLITLLVAATSALTALLGPAGLFTTAAASGLFTTSGFTSASGFLAATAATSLLGTPAFFATFVDTKLLLGGLNHALVGLLQRPGLGTTFVGTLQAFGGLLNLRFIPTLFGLTNGAESLTEGLGELGSRVLLTLALGTPHLLCLAAESSLIDRTKRVRSTGLAGGLTLGLEGTAAKLTLRSQLLGGNSDWTDGHLEALRFSVLLDWTQNI